MLRDLAAGAAVSVVGADVALAFGIAVSRPNIGDELTAAGLSLLETLFRSRIGFSWPSSYIAGGIIDARTFDQLVSGLTRELEEHSNRSRSRRSEIVEAARRLGLHPEPTGTYPDYWQARCPGQSHGFEIKASSDEFFCGYCGKTGGPDELEALVVGVTGRRPDSCLSHGRLQRRPRVRP